MLDSNVTSLLSTFLKSMETGFQILINYVKSVTEAKVKRITQKAMK